MAIPYISIVIPLFNEQESLENLCHRLLPVLDTIGNAYEIIFVNDGSTDLSEKILEDLHKRRPDVIRLIYLNSNYGENLAIMAGFEYVRGEIIITMDADLQNLPEDIPRLVATMEQGFDVVGGYRENRQDSLGRRFFSKIHKFVREKLIPNLTMRDQGCKLRAYRRNIVDLMIANKESNPFIPILALSYASKATDIPVAQQARHWGKSKYNLYRLIRYNFDLVTNFSLMPLQLFTLIGILVSCFSGILVVYLLLRRLFDGPEAQGVFSLFAIAFFFIGLCLLGLGILGEYIGRIYQEVRQRPRFVIQRIIDTREPNDEP